MLLLAHVTLRTPREPLCTTGDALPWLNCASATQSAKSGVY